VTTSKYRSRASVTRLIALAISYRRDQLLARGLGLEHLRELMLRIARPMVRQGASLAYGGHWKETEDNFTYDLLRLIAAEQEDNSLGGPDTNLTIGRLYNHAAWPSYLDVTPRIEAQWINSCRVVRITQEMAGIAPADIVPDSEVAKRSDRVIFNSALTLSAMRRLAMTTMTIAVPELPTPEVVPEVAARVMLGGRVTEYSGFLPGLFEEALASLENNSPLYVLGGFGGAAEVIAGALLEPAPIRRDELTVEWHRQKNPAFAKLLELSAQFGMPAGVPGAQELFDRLFGRLLAARANLAATLKTGLDEAATRELLQTRDMRRAVQLVRQGLHNLGLVPLLL
jgi:hypothetical protein